MERYRYDPKLDLEKIEHWPHTRYRIDRIGGFAVYDTKFGTSDGTHMAFCRSRDDAEKIVEALNAVDKGGRQ